MARIPILPLVTLALLLTAGALAAQPARFELEARYWTAELDGRVRAGDGGEGTLIGLTDTLDIDDDRAWELRGSARPIGGLVLRAAYVPLEFAGDAQIDETIEFGGREFTIDTRVLSAIDLEYATAGIGWMFTLPTGILSIGPIVEAKGVRGEATLEAPDLPVRVAVTEKFEAAAAAAGLIAELRPLSRLHFFGEGSVSVATSQGDLLDFALGVKYLILQNLALVGGYRSLEIDAEEDGDRFEVDLKGYFLGVGLRF